MDETGRWPIPQQGQAAAPGWYPTDGGMLRYWDGWQWTPHVQPPAPNPAPVHHVHHHQPPMIVSDQRTSAVEVTLAWVFTAVSVGYLLPWAIAASRGKSNSLAIGLLNFFLGWTVIGWVVSLVMACQPHQVAAYRY